MNHNKLIAVGLILTLGLMITAGCLSGEKEKGVEFSTGPCEDINYNQSDLGIKEEKWINENTLFVKGTVDLNCAENITNGRAVIQDNQIMLKTSIESPQNSKYLTECRCIQEINYTIHGLEKKEYTVELW